MPPTRVYNTKYMKTNKMLSTLICVVMALAVACACLLAACTTEEKTLVPMSEVILSEDHVLRWQPVEGATHYSLRVNFDETNGFEVPVNGTEYILKLYTEGTYTLRVRPVLDTEYGAYSEPILYTVEKEVVVTPSEDGKVVLRGAGTVDDPLLIYTKEELISLTDGMREVEQNGETVRMQNYYRLMADIDLSGEEWTSIGNSAKPFSGIFDGNGHTIKGMTQTKLNGTALKRNGLFGTITQGTVVNLNMVDVHIELGLITEDCSLGGLVGYTTGATVENCSVQGSIVVNSPQSGQKRCYAGLLVGYSNGTAMRRVSTKGKVDVTYSAVYAGGMAGLCSAPELDSMQNCISRVNVLANGTGTSGNNPAGRAYAAGFAYISNTGGIANCVWLGTAKATVKVGTPADEDMYYEGMFVCSSSKTVKGECTIALSDCFYDIAGIAYNTDVYDEDLYASHTDLLNAIANRYVMGGATGQKRTSSVYGVDSETLANRDMYAFDVGGTMLGLDFDSVWTMTADGPALAPYHSRWHNVQFVLDDGTVFSTQNVLKGQSATLPTYVGEEGFALQWDLDPATPIEEDMQIHLKH